MIGKARSQNGVPIRLTEERWYHIVEHHEDLAGYAAKVLEAIEEPDFIVAGWVDELLAVKELEDGKYIVAVYKEVSNEDGFVITAYFTTKVDRIRRRGIRWSK
ncbi:MAG: PBECR2 nuclease fold domain-containing protein [Candidatus Bipolaricaulia bacterium]